MDQVNEGSSYIVTVAFTGEDGAAITPSSASYRVDDVGSGAAIKASTVIESLGASVDIPLGPEETKILNEAHAFETRLITVSFEYTMESGDTGYGTAEHLIQIKNLFGVTTND